MLLNDIVKKYQEKPAIDWDAYCRWKITNSGSLLGNDVSVPVVWKCSCGEINSSVAGEKYGTCQHCDLVFLSFPK